MLVDEGAAARMLERRRRYEENPFELHDTGNDYHPVFGPVHWTLSASRLVQGAGPGQTWLVL